MNREPRIQDRAAQHYAGIPKTVTMTSLSEAVDEAFPELFRWLAQNGLQASAPPIIRYFVIDMAADLQIELGVPVAAPVAASGRIRPGVLPAGRYAVVRHVGPYDELAASNAALLAWAGAHGVVFDAQETAEGSVWHSRVEHYLTDPSAEPDPAKWEVDVACLTREA